MKKLHWHLKVKSAREACLIDLRKVAQKSVDRKFKKEPLTLKVGVTDLWKSVRDRSLKVSTRIKKYCRSFKMLKFSLKKSHFILKKLSRKVKTHVDQKVALTLKTPLTKKAKSHFLPTAPPYLSPISIFLPFSHSSKNSTKPSLFHTYYHNRYLRSQIINFNPLKVSHPLLTMITKGL